MAQVPELQPPQPINLLGQYAQIQQIKGAQQEQQARAMQLQQEQMAMGSQQALMQAYTQSGGDLDKTFESATKSGKVLPGDLIKLKEATLTQKQKALEYVNAKGARAVQESDLMQGAHDQVAALPPEQRPQAWQQALGQLQNAGVDISQAPQQYPGDQAFSQMGLQLKGHAAMVAEAAKKLENDKTVAQTGEANAKAAEANASAAKTTTEADQLKQFGGMKPEMADAKYLQLQTLKNQGAKLGSADNAFIQAYEHKKTLVPVATVNLQAGLLSDQAKQMAAQNYATTGQLPSGMRSPAMSAQVLNTAAKNGPVDIAANKANYQADSGSLKTMQKQFDNVTAFENTAGKNLDQFLKTAKDVVDSGSPFLNTPLRQITSQMVGSEKMAAFNAARQTALTEISKVLSSANASSGVVSDSARHEVEGMIGPNATLKQIYAAAGILKQDMANRHQSYSDQIKEIKGRMGSQPAPQPAADQGHGGALKIIRDPQGRIIGVE